MRIVLPLVENIVSFYWTADGVQHITVTLAVYTFCLLYTSIQTAFKASERRKEDHDSAFQSYSDRTAAAGNGIWLFK